MRINRRELSYDAAGHLRADRSTRRAFGYDDSGRLSTFTRRGTLKAAYRYDGQGRRIIKLRHAAKGRQRTHFHYAPDGRLLAETVYNHQGIKKTVREYLWLDNMPLAQIRTRYRNNGTIKTVQKVFLHPDHKKTPITRVVQEPVPGDWKITKQSHPHEKQAAGTAVWKIQIPAEGKATLSYTVQLRY